MFVRMFCFLVLVQDSSVLISFLVQMYDESTLNVLDRALHQGGFLSFHRNMHFNFMHGGENNVE